MGNISPQDLDALITIFQDSTWKELRLSFGETTLILSKDSTAELGDPSPVSVRETVTKAEPRAAKASPPAAAPESKAALSIPAGCVVVRAPSLGSFYRAPKPGSPAFCDTGQKIEPQQELGLLEVMKLFTTVRSDVSGTIREILAKDGEMVEFDQPLFLIELDG